MGPVHLAVSGGRGQENLDVLTHAVVLAQDVVVNILPLVPNVSGALCDSLLVSLGILAPLVFEPVLLETLSGADS